MIAKLGKDTKHSTKKHETNTFLDTSDLLSETIFAVFIGQREIRLGGREDNCACISPIIMVFRNDNRDIFDFIFYCMPW